MQIKLDEDFLATRLVCPPGKTRVEFVDRDGVRGLYIECRGSSRGEGTYYLRYKDAHGKTCHQRLGGTRDMSLAEARAAAKKLKAQITLGADPRAEAKARREVPTYSAFFETHYLPYVKLRKRSWDRDEELYRLRIKDVFGSKRLNQITRQQIQLFHSRLMEEGLAPATANHHIKLIKHSLYLAIDWGLLEKNPAARIPLFPELNQVEHYLDDEALGRLLTVLRTDPNRPICQIALFLLSTGCRLNEALSAKWDDIDLERKAFRIRAGNSKSKKVRSIPLSDSALGVLNGLDTRGEFDHVFINRRRGKPYTNIAKVWDRLRTKAGLPHLRCHDLRHQFASFLVNEGFSLYTVQTLLGHATPSVTMRYSHLSTKALQSAVDSASIKITGEGPPAE